MKEIVLKCNLELKKYKTKALEYYKENREEVIRNIGKGTPQILFITSRFTTALQYHIRDSKGAAERMRLETDLLMEKDRLKTGWTYLLAMKKATEFKPNIIFVIDHFRFEYNELQELQEIIWMTWLQDPLFHIRDKETPSKLSERDFVMNVFSSADEIGEIWNPFPRTMDAFLVANPFIYKPYSLTKEEEREYGADLCMVYHVTDVEEGVVKLIKTLECMEEEKIVIKQILYDYYNFVKIDGQIFFTREDMKTFIYECAKNVYNFKFNDKLVLYLVGVMCLDLAHRMYCQIIADWLIEAGYHNIKLWGNGWLKNRKYQKYAMGSAQNGEVLSKIYQSTKIVLGSNFYSTAVARVWESMLSGAFYVGNYVPPETDTADFRRILKEDKNIVIYHNRKDLLNKVDYYLMHEKEWKQMAEKGRKIALKEATFDSLMKKMLDFLKESLKLENGN